MTEERAWILNPAGQQGSGQWIDDTLAERVREAGMTARTPLVGRFPRTRVEAVPADDLDARVTALFQARGWTDGLPVVAPTTARVRRMLRFTRHSPDHSLGDVDPLKGLATIEKIAANAVMAGCLPSYLPVVVAAVEAILDADFNLRGVQTTDENVAPLLVVNGPVADALGINAGFGALGPGWRANASIGRAVRLVMNNLGGGWPGTVSFAGLAQPGRYSLCLAENTAESPWEPLHVEAGFAAAASVVTVMRAESVINVTGGLAEIASVMGTAASAFAAMWSGRSTVIVSPALAAALAAEGMSKAAVKAWLFAHGRWPSDGWRASWLFKTVGGIERWPAAVRDAAAAGAVPVAACADDLVLVVAGGNVPIAQHAYCPAWGFPPARISRAIDLPENWDELLAEEQMTHMRMLGNQ
ncbi:MAG: hypothetical protein JNM90_10620 [Burkholderiales bacterium]|nr:hypothetical protein [Burkholderiales bacterium]